MMYKLPNGQTIDLRPQEHAVLEAFAAKAGVVGPGDIDAALAQHSLPQRHNATDNHIKVVICRLRKKLDVAGYEIVSLGFPDGRGRRFPDKKGWYRLAVDRMAISR